jgi:hypothetical protein
LRELSKWSDLSIVTHSMYQSIIDIVASLEGVLLIFEHKFQ